LAQRPVRRPGANPETRPAFTLEFATSKAEKNWLILLRERETELTECWDYLSASPEQRSRRCGPLRGEYAGIWQYEIGPKQRVWYEIDSETVVILAVHRVHPKGTE